MLPALIEKSVDIENRVSLSDTSTCVGLYNRIQS